MMQNLSPDEIYRFVLTDELRDQVDTAVEEFERKYGGVKLNDQRI